MWYNKDMNKQITMSTISHELATVRTKKKNFWIRSIASCRGENGWPW